jgi:hypothetical protein
LALHGVDKVEQGLIFNGHAAAVYQRLHVDTNVDAARVDACATWVH